jgi:hypothetical protein
MPIWQPPRNPGANRTLRVLIACEFSGKVRDAFTSRGHKAVSCDLMASETPGEHYTGHVQDIIHDNWDMMIAFPPCTYLANSGNRWHAGSEERTQALEFIRWLMTRDIEHIAIENPAGAISSRIRKPDQVIQPWWFGKGEVKTTCLWLKGLPKLVPTDVVEGREQRVWKMGESGNRWKERSRTYDGVARAMANQWG